MARVSVSPRLAVLLLLPSLLLVLLAPSAEAEKPGVCPALPSDTMGTCDEACSDDESCPGEEKCCSNGCGNHCVQPEQLHPIDPLPDKPGACRYVNTAAISCVANIAHECKGDWECKGSQKCCNTGCVMRCSEPVADKDGSCPYVDTRLIKCAYRPDLDKCQQDWQCPGKAKCCTTGCAKICRKPVKDKAGVCPYVDTRLIKCAYTPDECQQDWQCPGKAKCCNAGCSKICRKPVKPGTCPVYPTGIYCFRYQNDCSSDCECTGGKKCCDVPCGVGCVDPVK